MSRAPTLEDVAEHAGVSTATVSRVLNSPDQVAEKTKNRVLKAVEALGYTPNFSARALAAKRTKTIGAVVPTIDNAIFAEGLQAFQQQVQMAGYTLLIASSGYDPKVEADEIRTLVARGVDGLLLIGLDRAPEIEVFLTSQNLPTVVAWAYDPKSTLPAVGFDNQAAMQNLAVAALQMGHRNIGVVTGHLDGNDRARARVAGILAAISQAGLPKPPIVETAYDVAKGQAAARSLLDRHPGLTLVMCGNDVLAAGAYLAAEDLKLSVPHDLSITGFDDLTLAELMRPALTTVRVPHKAMGETAAETLLNILAGTPKGGCDLPVQLRLRGSLGLPKLLED